MTGRIAAAPCGHPGNHVTAAYIQCAVGCDRVIPESFTLGIDDPKMDSWFRGQLLNLHKELINANCSHRTFTLFPAWPVGYPEPASDGDYREKSVTMVSGLKYYYTTTRTTLIGMTNARHAIISSVAVNVDSVSYCTCAPVRLSRHVAIGRRQRIMTLHTISNA